MMKKISFIVILVTVLSMTIPLNTTRAQPATTVQMAPATSTVGSGSTFTVNITITNVTDLAVWEFKVLYLNTVLNCISATEGPFLVGEMGTFFTFTINNAYDPPHGMLLLGSTLNGPVPGVNGSGTLATITFQAQAAGDTPLHFDNDITWSFLKDSTPPPDRQFIPYTAVDGTVHVTGGAHDLAVTAVTPLKTSIGQTYTGNVNVTIQNQGSSTETFNLTLSANTTVIDTIRNMVLQSATYKNVTFTWDTTGFAMGNYIISAYAWPVSGETNTANNNLTGGLVKVTFPGDVVAPYFKVDMGDISAVLDAFGSRLGSDGNYWHRPPGMLDPHSPNMDIDSNGQVDMGDVTIALGNFGKHL